MYDLSHPIEEGMQTYPGDPEVHLEPIEAEGARITALRCGSHTGTHVDAPAHTEPDGETLDAYPVERFAMRAVVVDCTDIGAREAIPPERVPDRGADCLVFHTGWDEYWGTDRYLDHPYLDPETARACAARGYDVGVDTLNPDPTPSSNARDDEPEGVPSHRALLGDGRLVVENLTGLGRLPERFELRVSPLPLGADGAPARAVGVAPE